MSNLRALHQKRNPWDERHQQACESQQDTYVDPQTGYQVFSAHGLKKRGACCGSGCRHCPYSYEAVPTRFKAG